jgi:hypothetical protein
MMVPEVYCSSYKANNAGGDDTGDGDWDYHVMEAVAGVPE